MTLVRSIFLRGLGLIYLIAFLSLGSQLEGLIGSEGIAPAAELLENVRENKGASFLNFPTLVWISSSDTFLRALSTSGAILSVLLVFGVAPVVTLSLLFLLYLSFNTMAWPFFPFQWDSLLLETGFLAVFLAPWTWRLRQDDRHPVSMPIIWVFRWLVFRLHFSSGFVKIRADEVWRDLTALDFHYFTQPLPPWTAWFADGLPPWFDRGCVAYVLTVETAVPFLLLLIPFRRLRRVRLAGFLALVSLQILILATGNYTFFNLLTLFLCMLLLDDGFLRKGRFEEAHRQSPLALKVHVAIATALFTAGLFPFLRTLQVHYPKPTPLAAIEQKLNVFHISSSYGLFANMTTTRPEIILESSMDGEDWAPVPFKHKVGPLTRRPGFVAPHQPRLDWQMWFAALGNARQNPWFLSFCRRLMLGSKPVFDLLGEDPFPEGPPRFLRARVFDYKFTNREERARTGDWWKRTELGSYIPPVTLDAKQRLIVFSGG